MMTITGYCLEWQTITHGGSAHDLIVEPLMQYVDVQLKGWDGVSWPGDAGNVQHSGFPIIFSHLPPPPELLENSRARLVWLPMWDHARGYSQEWWDALPKSLRVVAFSNAVAQKARAAGLPTLRLRYFENPGTFEPARWNNDRVLMYWNRTGMIGPRFVKKLCAALKIDKMLFRAQIDRRIPEQAAYRLPARLGRTIVEELPGLMLRAEYLRVLEQANVFIAPRLYEGVGMTFLEALAQGCAVFGFDAPTMNEYITHGEDGYLLQPFLPSMKNKFLPKINRFMKPRLLRLGIGESSSFEHPVTEYQDWCAIGALDLEKLGRTARQRHQIGFVEWQKSIPEYARFVLEW